MGCHSPPVTPLGSALGPLLRPRGLERARSGGFPPLAIPGTSGQRRETSAGGFGAPGGPRTAPSPSHVVLWHRSLLGLPFLNPPPTQGRAERRRVAHAGAPPRGRALLVGPLFSGGRPTSVPVCAVAPASPRGRARVSCAAAPAPTSPGCVRASTTRHRHRPRPRWNQNWGGVGGGGRVPSPPAVPGDGEGTRPLPVVPGSGGRWGWREPGSAGPPRITAPPSPPSPPGASCG